MSFELCSWILFAFALLSFSAFIVSFFPEQQIFSKLVIRQPRY